MKHFLRHQTSANVLVGDRDQLFLGTSAWVPTLAFLDLRRFANLDRVATGLQEFAAFFDRLRAASFLLVLWQGNWWYLWRAHSLFFRCLPAPKWMELNFDFALRKSVFPETNA